MTEALLALEDGTSFRGRSLGAEGETFGEAVFNTGMSGYQEVLTDPSYARQIVLMTYPHQGNYGVNREDPESGEIRVAGLVVREASRRPSSWRAEGTLHDALERGGVVGIEGLDTRALTLHLRDLGAMRAAISTVDLDAASLSERARAEPAMAGADLARTVSTGEAYPASDVVGSEPGARSFRVAAFDWGIKRSSLRLLAGSGCETTVVPALTPPSDILAGGFDGVFLSNGPGDPAATRYAVETARALVGRVPLFGICLGHQVLARAVGGATFKLRFGHRGANQPVLDTETGRVEITSHNHGFAVDPSSWTPSGGGSPDRRRPDGRSGAVSPPDPSPDPRRDGTLASNGWPQSRVVDTQAGRAVLSHWNLNDGTLEGMRLLDLPAFSVQYHPEGAPGTHDSAHLFDRFTDLMRRGGW